MDTPGVLWPKFESNEIAHNLAFTGTIKDDKLDKQEIDSIMEKDIEENDKIYTIMQIIAKKRGAILSGGRIDDEKISGIILDEFRSGKLGKITLEKANI